LSMVFLRWHAIIRLLDWELKHSLYASG
jgi:hypothetical protein